MLLSKKRYFVTVVTSAAAAMPWELRVSPVRNNQNWPCMGALHAFHTY